MLVEALRCALVFPLVNMGFTVTTAKMLTPLRNVRKEKVNKSALCNAVKWQDRRWVVEFFCKEYTNFRTRRKGCLLSIYCFHRRKTGRRYSSIHRQNRVRVCSDSGTRKEPGEAESPEWVCPVVSGIWAGSGRGPGGVWVASGRCP